MIFLCNFVCLYCYGFNIVIFFEYIILLVGFDRNYVSFYRGRLFNFESCLGLVNFEFKLIVNYWGIMRYVFV